MRPLVRAMANEDSEKPEQGRLLSDALEFSQTQASKKPNQQGILAATDIHSAYKAGDVLGGKYTITDVLGKGRTGVTYKVTIMFNCAEPLACRRHESAELHELDQTCVVQTGLGLVLVFASADRLRLICVAIVCLCSLLIKYGQFVLYTMMVAAHGVAA